MTIPLVVLAALSTLGGFFNVEPEVPIVNWFLPVAGLFGGEAALHHWLHPVIEGAEGVWGMHAPEMLDATHPAWPIVLAIVIGIGGLALAWMLIRPRAGRIGAAAEEPAYTGGLEKTLYHKWYIDEIYDAIVVRPVRGLSRAFYSVVDRGVIDGVVDGAGRVAQGIGLVVGRAQSGQLNTYAFTIILGALLVLGAFVAF